MRSTKRSVELKLSTREPIGTSIWRAPLPLLTEIERAVETSMIGIRSWALLGSTSSGSATSGLRSNSASSGFGLGSDVSIGDDVFARNGFGLASFSRGDAVFARIGTALGLSTGDAVFTRNGIRLGPCTGDAVLALNGFGLGSDISSGDAVMFACNEFLLALAISTQDAVIFACNGFGLRQDLSRGESVFTRRGVDLDLSTGDAVFARNAFGLGSDISRGDAKMFVRDEFALGPSFSREDDVFVGSLVAMGADVLTGDAVMIDCTGLGLGSDLSRGYAEVFARNGFRLGAETSGDSVIVIGSALMIGAGPTLSSADLFSFACFAGGGGGSCPVLIVRFGRFRRDFSFAGGLSSGCNALWCC